jgi:hypothetical protein
VRFRQLRCSITVSGNKRGMNFFVLIHGVSHIGHIGKV